MMQPVPLFQLGTAPDPRYEGEFVADWHQLPIVPGVLIITEPDQQDALLMALHGSQRFWQWRIYVSTPSELSPAMSDGASLPEDLDAVWKEHLQSFSLIKHGEDSPLLSWLWLDDARKLLPVRQTASTQIYRYPLLEAYTERGTSLERNLVYLVQRGYLEEEVLVDKVRFCPACHSGHINYVETCPSCHSLDIQSEQSLHCFTCGHVAAQDAFTRSGKLVCPNCLTQLRHIGVDYDRPLERYVCRNCKERFSEAETQARCLTCDTFSAPNELIARQIFQYRVGPQTTFLLRHGQSFQLTALSLNSLVDKSFLLSLLPWLNKLARRHQLQHLLIALNLPDLQNYGQRHGELKTIELTEQLSERLNGLLRDTDLCCQYLPDTLLLLMPNTPDSALEILQGKISSLAAMIDMDEFVLRVFAWTLPDTALDDDAAGWLAFKTSEFAHD